MERTDNELKKLVEAIEKKTDFDVLNWSWFKIEVIDRNGDDGKVESVKIYGKSEIEILKELKSL